MLRCSEIIDIPIFNDDSKEAVSLVYDIVLKKNSYEISGFIWKKRLLKKDFGIILYRDIKLISRDGLNIKKGAASIDFDYDDSLYFGLSYKQDFLNKIVLNSKGELIGIVRDVMLDPDKRYFHGLELSEGYIDDIISGRKLILTGTGYRIEPESITVLTDSVIQEQGGGLLNKFE